MNSVKHAYAKKVADDKEKQKQLADEQARAELEKIEREKRAEEERNFKSWEDKEKEVEHEIRVLTVSYRS